VTGQLPDASCHLLLDESPPPAGVKRKDVETGAPVDTSCPESAGLPVLDGLDRLRPAGSPRHRQALYASL